MSGLATAHSRIRFGVFELDVQTGELRKSGFLLHLPPQPFKVLALLVSHPAQLVTREEMRDQIWGTDTFVDFEHGLNAAIKTIRDTLGDDPETPRYIETLPRRGYRFIAPVDGIPTTSQSQASIQGAQSLQQTTSVPAIARKSARFRWAVIGGATILIIGVLLVGSLFFYSRRAHVLTEKDAIVLADFINTTGDPVFDGALRQGLSVQLEQTPFIRPVSGDQIAQTLRLMEKPPDTRLTHDVAREVCERVNATVVIEGSIATLGNQYVLGLNAMNCSTGETLAAEQVTADAKEKVLTALGNAASDLRSKLGESRASLEAYDVPLDQVTTSSLEALQALSQGGQRWWSGDIPGAASFYQRAVALDPNFAAAYSMLGVTQYTLGDDHAAESMTKAYELRGRTTEFENLQISRVYHHGVTGDFEKALQISQHMNQAWPHNPLNLISLVVEYMLVGRYAEALAPANEATQLNPTPLNYEYLTRVYIGLNRLDEASATIARARAAHMDSPILGLLLWDITYFRDDQAGMAANEPLARRVDPAIDAVLAMRQGRLSRARAVWKGLIVSDVQANRKEAAAARHSLSAIADALVGRVGFARTDAKRAIQLSNSWRTLPHAGLALAMAGDSPEAQKLVADLNQRFPQATDVQSYYLPATRAALALRQGRPQDAISSLHATLPYDLLRYGGMIAVYLRGQAYLDAHQGPQAAAEFQKILDHLPIAATSGIAPAHLGLARAYALEGDTAKARAAYQDFLTLWKDADPDIPILKQAQTEYAKLQ